MPLRRRTDASDGFASRASAGLLREPGNLEVAGTIPRRRANWVGDVSAADELVGLLREQGNLDELREQDRLGKR